MALYEGRHSSALGARTMSQTLLASLSAVTAIVSILFAPVMSDDNRACKSPKTLTPVYDRYHWAGHSNWRGISHALRVVLAYAEDPNFLWPASGLNLNCGPFVLCRERVHVACTSGYPAVSLQVFKTMIQGVIDKDLPSLQAHL